MKKILFTIVIISVVFASEGAKVYKRNNISMFGEKMVAQAEHVIRKNEVKNINPDLVKIWNGKQISPIKMGSKPLLNTSVSNNHSQNRSNASINSVPERLIGTFFCKGLSFFGGFVTGETVITADISNANKIWFSNLIPGASNKKVYGIVSSDQKTISIPQGQQIFLEGTDKAILSIFDSAESLVGQFDATTGVITITTANVWGAEASDGWFELFSGKVTYTRTDMLPPFASYRQPSGGLFLGLDPNTWGSYSSSCIINSPYVTWNWRNNNIEKDVTYLWSCTDSISNKKITSDKDSLLMDVEDSYYNTPNLLATNKKGLSSSYILGADYLNKGNSSFSIAGGNGAMLDFDAACDYGVANLDNGFTLLTYNEDSYYFGTGASKFSDNNYESLMVYYEKPLSTLYFEGVNVYLMVFDAPVNTPFTMNVVLSEKNAEGHSVKGKVIASSTILAKDVLSIMNDNKEVVGYTMKFVDFKTIDNDGFEITKEYIESDKAFYLELTGFNVPSVKLAACTEEINPLDSGSRSCFMVKDDPSIFFWNNYRQTMYFNLAGAAYSYISLSDSSIYDEKSGGTYSVEAIPFFDTLYYDKALVPDWLNVEITNEEYSDTTWGATVKVTIDPLPANSDPRAYGLELHTVAATRVLHINQSCQVSTGEIKKAPLASAFKNEQGFLIKYPSEMNTLSVYSANGAFVGRYKLSDYGSFQLNGSTLSSGLYILKLQGTKRVETIKVVKD